MRNKVKEIRRISIRILRHRVLNKLENIKEAL